MSGNGPDVDLRPPQPADQRYQRAYLFGAICPDRGATVRRWRCLLPIPRQYAAAPRRNLSHSRQRRPPRASLLDRAGWHITSKLDMPENITPIFLPSRAPELNPVENVWQYLRQNWISNTVFENYDAIVDAACDTWRKLTARPRNDHLHRNARLGTRRSVAMTFGIIRPKATLSHRRWRFCFRSRRPTLFPQTARGRSDRRDPDLGSAE